MKKLIVCTVGLLFLSLAFARCDDGEKPILPLELENVRVRISEGQPTVTVPITSGNGGYYISYPEQVEAFPSMIDGAANLTKTDVDYKDDMFEITIDDRNNIYIEFNASYYSTIYETLSCNFIIRDSKGESQYLIVNYALYWLCCLQ